MRSIPLAFASIALFNSIALAGPDGKNSRRACRPRTSPAIPAQSSVGDAALIAAGNDTKLALNANHTEPATTSQGTATSGNISFSPGNKRGIVQVAGTTLIEAAVRYWNDVDSIKWMGNYYHGPPPGLSPRINFVPQMYAWDSNLNNDMPAHFETSKAAGNKYILAFGEAGTPNEKLHMDAKRAADVWRKELQPFAKDFSISAANNLCSDEDWRYLDDFLDECSDCPIGFLSFHIFGYLDTNGDGTPFERLKKNTERLIERSNRLGGIPIWVENIQGWAPEQEQMDYLREVIPYLENNPRVQRYAYVSPSKDDPSGELGAKWFGDDGSVSKVAKYYADFPTDGSVP